MSDHSAQPEPSMEEILAKIRRIIAEEDRPDSPGATPPQTGTALPLNTAPAANAVPPPAPVQAEPLDLTEAIQEDGSVRHLGLGAAASVGGGSGRVVSDSAAAAVRNAFGELARSAERRREPELAIGGGSSRTLEDIVREALRPLLQAWLDENLPGLVERLVRAELARVVDEAGLR